jgi:hypothetical protein
MFCEKNIMLSALSGVAFKLFISPLAQPAITGSHLSLYAICSASDKRRGKEESGRRRTECGINQPSSNDTQRRLKLMQYLTGRKQYAITAGQT